MGEGRREYCILADDDRDSLSIEVTDMAADCWVAMGPATFAVGPFDSRGVFTMTMTRVVPVEEEG